MRSSLSVSEMSLYCRSVSQSALLADSFSGFVLQFTAMDSANIGTKYSLIKSDKDKQET